VYDLKTKSLTQLGGKNQVEDQEYLGPHEDFSDMLADFVKGDIIKSSKIPRKSYMG